MRRTGSSSTCFASWSMTRTMGVPDPPDEAEDVRPPIDAHSRLAEVARELHELADRDQRVRAELAADGSLFKGYHPRMEAVHRENAARLASILEELGWPTEALVGSEAAEAAWLIAQHAIGAPGLQRRALG